MHKIQAINKDIKKLLVIDCRFHLFGNPMNSLFQEDVFSFWHSLAAVSLSPRR